MKKLALLILLLVVSLKSFSQSDTQKDECYICLDSIRTREVIKDIITGDAAKEENNVLKDIVANLKAQNSLLELNVSDLSKQKNNLEAVNEGQKELTNMYRAAAAEASEQLKKEKVKSTFYKVSSVVAVVGSIILVISK